ncbi:MFS transporter [Yinghuangia soli]|uniref:MFS transporter n=1 Tax=Yinghuangia soli TaxID=2908204 RepID=A0AA41U2H4_9ACTN|nr:MFS transporter [Yinghuangia soli]MCF2531793.1 MFS transporter [Yinghuangia soli]
MDNRPENSIIPAAVRSSGSDGLAALDRAATTEEKPDTPSTRGLPFGVYLLAFSLFTMGSAEFLLAGVLPDVADDIHVSLASAGGLITAFAVGVVVGGPPFAIASLRWPRRTALVLTQVVFAASIAAGLVIGTYPALLATRFVAGLAYAGFFAVAAATAVGLVAPDRAARASGVVVSGLGLAMTIGGPAGTIVSQHAGWEGGFWLVVAFTLAGAVAVAVAMPRTSTGPAPSVRRELRTMKRPGLWLVYAATLLSTAAYMITVNYLAELLDDVTGVPEVWVAVVLMLFGVGAYIGLAIGGRIADRRPHHALLAGTAGIAVCSVLIALLAEHPLAVVPLVLLLGVAGFVLNPAVYGRVFALAADAPTLAGAATVSAFQLGISVVPLLAGVALDAGAPVTAVAWIGAGLAVLTVPVVLLERASVKADGPASARRESPVRTPDRGAAGQT